MFAIIPRAIQYAAFFARLSTAHVQVEEFDSSTNCARVTVEETGFPGNEVCIDTTWVPGRVETSDVVFEQEASPPVETTSDLPDVAKKSGL